MAEYRITITGFDTGLNEMLNGVFFDYKAKRLVNRVKYKYDQLIVKQLRFSDLRNVKLKTPIEIYYHIYAKDKKHDRMNIGSAFTKCYEDALQKAGILHNDGWDCVVNSYYEFDVDRVNPRIEVRIVEIENEAVETPKKATRHKLST